MNLFKLLNANNYISINRPFAHAIGLDAAIFFSEVLDKHEYFQKEGTSASFPEEGDEWFYLTMEDVQERTTLGRKEQEGAIAKLLELGFIKKIIKGVPAKRYFQVQKKSILSYFDDSKNLSRMSQKDKLECPKRTNQNVPKGHSIYKNQEEEPKKEEAMQQCSSHAREDKEIQESKDILKSKGFDEGAQKAICKDNSKDQIQAACWAMELKVDKGKEVKNYCGLFRKVLKEEPQCTKENSKNYVTNCELYQKVYDKYDFYWEADFSRILTPDGIDLVLTLPAATFASLLANYLKKYLEERGDVFEGL